MSEDKQPTAKDYEKAKEWVSRETGYDPLQDPLATGQLKLEQTKSAKPYVMAKEETFNPPSQEQQSDDDEVTRRIKEYSRLANIKYTDDIEEYVLKNRFEIMNIDTEEIMTFRRKKISYPRYYEIQADRRELSTLEDNSKEKMGKEIPLLKKQLNYYLIDEKTGKAADPNLLDVLDLEETRKILDAMTLRTQFGVPK